MHNGMQPVTVRGRYFRVGDQRYVLRGVVYQHHRRPKRDASRDPLAEEHVDRLKRDIELFKELGLNALFVYVIDNSKNHDAAMQLLAEAGIYVLVCLSTPQLSINRSAPQDSYTDVLMESYFATVDRMAKYENTLGVLVGNAVISNPQSSVAAPVLRAVVRDLKRYMAMASEVLGQRRLLIGYSAADASTSLKATFDYLIAGDASERIDFFCHACYRWCGRASIEIAGYNKLLEEFAKTPVPIFFSEYGSNTISPRIFQETTAIYSPAMTTVYSGGNVYEFYYGANEYGLVELRTEDEAEKLVKLDDYAHLAERLQIARSEPNTDPAWADEQFAAAQHPPFPQNSAVWLADTVIPVSPLDWDHVQEELEIRDWVDVTGDDAEPGSNN